MATERQLRRSFAPYAGEVCILTLVSLAVLFVALRKHDGSIMLAALTLWLLAFVDFSFQFRYRIYWSDAEVRQVAAGGEVRLGYDDIAAVEVESGGSTGGVFPSRPFRRLAIYSRGPERTPVHVDISLRHFRSDDIQMLMNSLRTRRPDLALPKIHRGVPAI